MLNEEDTNDDDSNHPGYIENSGSRSCMGYFK